MIQYLRDLFNCNWSKWKDVSCTESLGYHTLIQCKVNHDTGKKKFRKTKIWVNDGSKIKEINDNVMRIS
jgi:hypothetical protein